MSKLSRLRDNIAAIECALKGENNLDVLNKYTGFGGLGFILNPIEDKSKWNKTDAVCYDDTVKLVELLRNYCGDEKKFKKCMASLKNSTLTAFYTPGVLVRAIMDAIYGHEYVMVGYDTKAGKFKKDWIKPKTFLDPAAGMGVFMNEVCGLNIALTQFDYTMTAFEKDILTAMMLKSRWSDSKKAFVYCDGFEHFPDDELGTYDLVSTNVPFGDISVFDDAYSNSALEVRRDAAKMIHRYYVLKGLDCLREGGILAYIITSNYINHDTEQLRYALQQSRLIGAYRLANNLFKENGTTVGTDLLVLQKDTKRGALTEDEEAICEALMASGCPTNRYFVRQREHIIATDAVIDTDAYGKKAVIYSHKDGVKGIAAQLGRVLAEDMKNHCDAELFGRSRGQVLDRSGRANQATCPHDLPTPVTVVVESTESKPKKKAKATKKVMLLEQMKGLYNSLYEYEMTNRQEHEGLRKELNAQYDLFVQNYGCLNADVNKPDVNRVAKDLLALEVRKDNGQSSMVNGQWTKADIMLKPVAFSTEEQEAGAMTAHEALAASLNEYGKPVMSYIAGLCGMDAEELIKALEGEVFWNPLNEEWEVKAKFISGNVVEKIEKIESLSQTLPKGEGLADQDEGDQGDRSLIARDEDGSRGQAPDSPQATHQGASPHDPRGDSTPLSFWRGVGGEALEALRAAVPAPIPFEQLDFNLGERWVDASIYEKFASDFFSMPESSVLCVE